MPRKKNDRSGLGDQEAQSSAEALAEHFLAAHADDPRAAWAAMNGPGGIIDQMLGRIPGNAGAAFGLGDASSLHMPDIDGLLSGPRFDLPDPPDQTSTLRVRVDLDDARPPIWRRLDLAGDLTLEEVHLVLQATFGWAGYHLHSFTPQTGEGKKEPRMRPFPNDGTTDFCDDTLPGEGEVRLNQLVRAEGDRLFYEYDFGDGWGHTLQVEKLLPRTDADPRAVCLGGRRAAPPEDAGGIWRYNEVIATLGGDRSVHVDEDELQEFLQWAGDDFDPEDAGLDDLDLDAMLRSAQRSRATLRVLVTNPRLAPSCTEVVHRAELTGALPIVAGLFVDAGVDLESEPPPATRAAVLDGLTAEEAAAAVQPWLTFLDIIGPDGAPLTSAGWLRPAVVETLFTTFDMGEDWIGKGNREDLTAPVACLRRAATALGLVRKYKNRLLPTKAATTASADPIRLWQHLADHLTRSRQEYERHAAVIALLTLASGATAPEPRHEYLPRRVPPRSTVAAFHELAPDVFGGLGWRLGDGAPSGYAARQWSETVWEVFDRSPALIAEGGVTPAGQRLARAALLTG